jgi:hypothetical protein
MSIPRDGPHRGIDCKFEFFSEFEFILEKALGYESEGWGTYFDLKNQRQNFSCQCPFKFYSTFVVLSLFIPVSRRPLFSLHSDLVRSRFLFTFCTKPSSPLFLQEIFSWHIFLKGTVWWYWDGLKLSRLDSALPVNGPHFVCIFTYISSVHVIIYNNAVCMRSATNRMKFAPSWRPAPWKFCRNKRLVFCTLVRHFLKLKHEQALWNF